MGLRGYLWCLPAFILTASLRPRSFRNEIKKGREGERGRKKKERKIGRERKKEGGRERERERNPVSTSNDVIDACTELTHVWW